MSWLSDIFAGGAQGLLGGVKDIIGTMKADPLELAKLNAAITQAELNAQIALTQAQTKINEIEASSTDKFVSRWRPAFGWLGVAGIGYATIIQPLGTWIAINVGAEPPPHMDTAVLMEIVTGLLGLAGMRSYDKLKGTSK